jgi:hypothetical protein
LNQIFRRFLALSLAGGLLALFPGFAQAGTLDQQQADAGGGGSTISTNASLAQTFTAGLTGTLDQVDLHLGKAGTPTAPLSVEIRAVSGGVPTGTILASQSVPESNIAPLAAFTSINFASPASVVAGTQYAIVAYSSTADANPYTWTANMNANPNPYAGGGPFFRVGPPPPPGVWSPDSSTLDYAFKTYVATIRQFSVSSGGVPPPMTVGGTGAQDLTLTNVSTGSETVSPNQIWITASCGTNTSPCDTPDLGVFSLASVTGTAGVCAGDTFTVAADNTFDTGGFKVTPPTPHTLAVNDFCTFHFVFNVLRVPTNDSDPGTTGVQTKQRLYVKLGETPTSSSSSALGDVTVNPCTTNCPGTPTPTPPATTDPCAGLGGKSLKKCRCKRKPNSAKRKKCLQQVKGHKP